MQTVLDTPIFHAGPGHFLSKAIDPSLLLPPVPQFEHPRYATPEEGEALLDRDGYLVIPGLFTGDESARLLHRLQHDGGPDSDYEVKNWCFNKSLGLDYQQHTEWLWALDKEPGIDQLDRLLGSDCRLMSASLWATGPGRAMGIHVDHQALLVPDGIAIPQTVQIPCFLAVLIGALEDQDPSMGPTMVVPGSHKRMPSADGPRQQPIGLVLKRGNGLLLRGDLCHGAMPNTGTRRHHFHSTWGNVYVETSGPPMRYTHYWAPEVIAAVSPRQRRILGGWSHANGGREAVWRHEQGLPPSGAVYGR